MLVCVASVKGSPGTTSTALSVAAVWPRPVVLLEADPAGGDLAYRCRTAHGGPVAAGPGLLTLAAAVRGGVPGPDVMVEHAQQLGCGVPLVQGVRSAGQARGLGGLWAALAGACRAAEVDVIADLGRLDQGSPATPLAQAADVVAPVAAASLESVMHLTQGLGELMPVLVRSRALAVSPVLVGPDSTAERDCADLDDLLQRSGHPVWPTRPVAYDPRALTRVEGGENPGSRLGRTLLLRRARMLATAWSGVVAEADIPTHATAQPSVGRGVGRGVGR